jgi:AcrR family transcriptional regulator
MRDKILEISKELFLNVGFKNVTMDEIANRLGVSKKTIYKYFSNKSALVLAVSEEIFSSICIGINLICDLNKNPIEEIFDIKRFVMANLNDEKSSPQFQLQKYYPKIFSTFKKRQFDLMQDCVVNNLNHGIQKGLYRKDIDVGFISRIYFHGMLGIKDQELFSLNEYSMNSLMNNYLGYHFRGICTEKGIIQLKNQITNN